MTRGFLHLTLIFQLVVGVAHAASDRLDADAAKAFDGTVYTTESDVPFPKGLTLVWEALANPGGEVSFYVAEVRKGKDAWLWLAEKTGEKRGGAYNITTVRDAIRLPASGDDMTISDSGCRPTGSSDDADRTFFAPIHLGEVTEGDNWRPAEGHAWRADLVMQRFLTFDPANLDCNHEQYGD